MNTRTRAFVVLLALLISPFMAFADEVTFGLNRWATGGTTCIVDPVVLRDGKVVTAVANGPNRPAPLKLIVWDPLGEGGKITRLGEHKAGTVSIIRAVLLPDGNVLTVVQTGHDLKLIVWNISPDGKTVTRLGEARAGSSCVIDAVVLPNGNVVTAVANGRRTPAPLKLILWSIPKGGKTITRLGNTKKHGTVRAIRVVARSDNKVVTAVRTGDDLKLIAWQIDGNKVTRLGDGRRVGKLGEFDAAVMRNGNVVTVRKRKKELEVNVWNIAGDGTFTEVAHNTEIPAREGKDKAKPTFDSVSLAILPGGTVVTPFGWESYDPIELTETEKALYTITQFIPNVPAGAASARPANGYGFAVWRIPEDGASVTLIGETWGGGLASLAGNDRVPAVLLPDGSLAIALADTDLRLCTWSIKSP